MDELPTTEIVSERLSTPGQAWVERDGQCRLWLRCGDHLYVEKSGMAPALAALVAHAGTCGEEVT
jgi:hypothetical protein